MNDNGGVGAAPGERVTGAPSFARLHAALGGLSTDLAGLADTASASFARQRRGGTGAMAAWLLLGSLGAASRRRRRAA